MEIKETCIANWVKEICEAGSKEIIDCDVLGEKLFRMGQVYCFAITNLVWGQGKSSHLRKGAKTINWD
jgi:hypothetical protein